MVSVGVSPLPNSFKTGEDINDWVDNLDDYFLACFKDEPADKNKIASLRRAIGTEHVKTVKELQSRLTDDDQKSYDHVKKAVIEHFQKKKQCHSRTTQVQYDVSR